jgi:hypothetical protein
MATTVSLTVAIDTLVAELARSWPADLATALGSPSTPEATAVAALIERARRGDPSSLPYLLRDKGRVLWVSVGESARRLLDYAEDLRSWLLQGYGAAGDIEFVQGKEGGRLVKFVHVVSPNGYLRWGSAASTLPTVLRVLSQMHAFMDRMPDAESESIPSIHVLRFRFVSALRCGEWDVAASVIDEIDRWGLEQAHKTMQMRLRLLGESGDHVHLMDTVERHHLWSLAHPTQVADAILEAFLQVVVEPLEATLPPSAVCEQLRPWYQKVVQVLPKVAPHGGLTRLFAYVACLDHDGPSAQVLLPHLRDPLAQFVRETCGLAIQEEGVAPSAPSPATDATPPPEPISQFTPGVANAYWVDLQRLVRHGSTAALDQHLSELDARVLEQADFLDQVPDALLELISDPEVDGRPAARNALQEVLTCLVDVSIGAPGFPSSKHLNLYLSLAESLVYLRGSSASEEDAHLLHGLLAAAANLSGPATHQCVELLRSWWKARPVLPRVGWLLAVLESLAPLHPDPGSMLDLWYEAVALATRKSLVLTLSQCRTWQRVGTLLELDVNTVSGELAKFRPVDQATESDPLAAVKWQKIAIVSLQESAAREAAKDLHARTGADVVVVSSLVQDGLTKAAEAADVILLVWAACSHAVYRAFDGHRDRLAYVQGTGTSSILSAAERMAERTLAVLA